MCQGYLLYFNLLKRKVGDTGDEVANLDSLRMKSREEDGVPARPLPTTLLQFATRDSRRGAYRNLYGEEVARVSKCTLQSLLVEVNVLAHVHSAFLHRSTYYNERHSILLALLGPIFTQGKKFTASLLTLLKCRQQTWL